MNDPAFERAIDEAEKLYHRQMAAAVGDAELILARRKLGVLAEVVHQLAVNYEMAKETPAGVTQ
jgi:hypothetical protein